MTLTPRARRAVVLPHEPTLQVATGRKVISLQAGLLCDGEPLVKKCGLQEDDAAAHLGYLEVGALRPHLGFGRIVVS